jgi:hypothetical protein
MGLLDDAIRQHLELKRRHGADPSEVARQEHEALGPPRRGTAAEDVELANAEELASDEAELYDNGAELVAEEPPRGADSREPSEPVREPEPTRELDSQAGAAAALDQPTHAYDAGDAADADPRGEAEAAEQADARDVRERAPDDAPGADPAQASEDVLEETPEFLQETPEHDRLWFEQKPPRDFDF